MKHIIFISKGRTIRLSLFLIAFLIASNTYAQVTIGSELPPNGGSLLDLKQAGTTKKGMAPPRVKLTVDNDITADISGVTSANADDHIGLVVQATEIFGINPVNCPGPYVWNGKKWKSLTPKETKPDITMTDGDGNEYKARWFGYDPCDISVGAYWTVVNLYSAKNGLSTAFTSGQPRMNPAHAVVSGGGGYISIPSTGIPTGTVPAYGLSFDATVSASLNVTGKSYKDFAKEYGLLYTQAQANEACPPGWHLPTDAEWLYLFSGQGGMELCAAKLRKPSIWGAYYTIDTLGSHTLQWGENDGDIQPVPSGFDAVPSGQVRGGDNSTDSWGRWAMFWSAEGKVYDVYYDQPDILDALSGSGKYISVRCVKD